MSWLAGAIRGLFFTGIDQDKKKVELARRRNAEGSNARLERILEREDDDMERGMYSIGNEPSYLTRDDINQTLDFVYRDQYNSLVQKGYIAPPAARRDFPLTLSEAGEITFTFLALYGAYTLTKYALTSLYPDYPRYIPTSITLPYLNLTFTAPSTSKLLELVPGAKNKLQHEVFEQVTSLIRPLLPLDSQRAALSINPIDIQTVLEQSILLQLRDMKNDGTSFSYYIQPPQDDIAQAILKVQQMFINTHNSPLSFPSLRYMENAIISTCCKMFLLPQLHYLNQTTNPDFIPNNFDEVEEARKTTKTRFDKPIKPITTTTNLTKKVGPGQQVGSSTTDSESSKSTTTPPPPPTGCGILASNDCEAILSTLKAYRDRAKDLFYITTPEIVLPITSHPNWLKCADLLNIRYHIISLKIVPHSKYIDLEVAKKLPIEYSVDLDAYKGAINRSTILLIGNAPTFAHGLIDPILEFCDIAQAKQVPLHIDASNGGMFLQFLKLLQQFVITGNSPLRAPNTNNVAARIAPLPEQPNQQQPNQQQQQPNANNQQQQPPAAAPQDQQPPQPQQQPPPPQQQENTFDDALQPSVITSKKLPIWDFRLPEISSININLSHDCYIPDGPSVVLYRTTDIRKYQFFTSSTPCGFYLSPTPMGPIPGHSIAGAWAGLQLYGTKGLCILTQRTLEVKQQLLEILLSEEYPEFEIIGTPLSSTISWKCKKEYKNTFNILSLADALELEKLSFNDGTTYTMQKPWVIERQHHPDSIRMLLTAQHKDTISLFLQDLAKAVQFVRENYNEMVHRGSAGMYNLLYQTSRISNKLVNDFLIEFQSQLLLPDNPLMYVGPSRSPYAPELDPLFQVQKTKYYTKKQAEEELSKHGPKKRYIRASERIKYEKSLEALEEGEK